MIIEYEGESYEFDFGDITVKQAMKIEKHTGLKLTEWGDTLAAEKGMNMIALQALGWLVLCRGEGAVDDADFKLIQFAQAAGRSMSAEGDAAADVPLPTGGAPASNGQTPAAGAAATELSSATG